MVCVLLYGIMLIQILLKYHVKNLITACTRLIVIHDSDPQNWKIFLPLGGGGGGGHPLPHPPPLGRFAPSGLVTPLPRICSQNIFCVFLEVRNHLPPPPPPPPPLLKTCLRHWLRFWSGETVDCDIPFLPFPDMINTHYSVHVFATGEKISQADSGKKCILQTWRLLQICNLSECEHKLQAHLSVRVLGNGESKNLICALIVR